MNSEKPPSAPFENKSDAPKINKMLCDGCSQCCEYVNIIIKKPQTKKEIDKVFWYILHNLTICIDKDNDWMVYLPFKCRALNKEKMCTIYNTRPTICREYTQMKCEKYNNDDEEQIFINEKEFLKYINSNSQLKKIYHSRSKNK